MNIASTSGPVSGDDFSWTVKTSHFQLQAQGTQLNPKIETIFRKETEGFSHELKFHRDRRFIIILIGDNEEDIHVQSELLKDDLQLPILSFKQLLTREGQLTITGKFIDSLEKSGIKEIPSTIFMGPMYREILKTQFQSGFILANYPNDTVQCQNLIQLQIIRNTDFVVTFNLVNDNSPGENDQIENMLKYLGDTRKVEIKANALEPDSLRYHSIRRFIGIKMNQLIGGQITTYEDREMMRPIGKKTTKTSQSFLPIISLAAFSVIAIAGAFFLGRSTARPKE